MSIGHLVENQNIDRNNIDDPKIQKERTQNAPKQQGLFVQEFFLKTLNLTYPELN